MQVALTVVTALEEEHLQALGGSLESIAAAKAGIVQPGGTVLLARQPFPGAAEALERSLRQQAPGRVLVATQCCPVVAAPVRWVDGHRALPSGIFDQSPLQRIYF